MCQLLGREKGFVYFEGDCMLGFINPFIPPDVENPSIAQKSQKGLKVPTSKSGECLILKQSKLQGVSREDFEVLNDAAKLFEDVFAKGNVDTFDEGMQPLLKLMSREVLKQKKRLGGNFAVAHAVVSR